MPHDLAIRTTPGINTLSAGIFTSNVDMGYKYISLKLVSGTVTYSAPTVLAGVVPPSAATQPPVTLDDTGFFISGENPIDGLIVDATLGVVIIAFTK